MSDAADVQPRAMTTQPQPIRKAAKAVCVHYTKVLELIDSGAVEGIVWGRMPKDPDRRPRLRVYVHHVRAALEAAVYVPPGGAKGERRHRDRATRELHPAAAGM